MGFGFDVHELTEGRPLVLGGIKIEHHQGLLGHSDADVVLHAVMDAILGALALGDIGKHFPNTDPQYRGADSQELTRHVWEMTNRAGFKLGNLDVMVLCEQPKLAPHIDAMRQCMARLFTCELSQVSVKATTMEGLGFIGKKEGIAAQAVVLLEEQAK